MIIPILLRLPFVQIYRIAIDASPMSATCFNIPRVLSFPKLTTPAAAPPTMAPMVAAGTKMSPQGYKQVID